MLNRFFRNLIRVVPAWVMAVLTTVIFAVIFQTQNVVTRLDGIGADVGLWDRLTMTGYDLIHLGSLYGAFIAVALLMAFLAGGLVYRFAKFGRPIVYLVAGAVAMVVMLSLMKEVFFGVPLIAGARSTVGIILQMSAGALGGLVFAWASRHKLSPKVDLEELS